MNKQIAKWMHGYTVKERKNHATIQLCNYSLNGFTLIELLVVIVIIGILSAFLVANFIGVRQRARDAQRKVDLRQIQSALEIYRADNGSYPTSFAVCGSLFASSGITYMQKIPCDPSLNNSYNYSSDGTVYSLVACLENNQDSQKDTAVNSFCAPPSTNVSYTLINP